MCHHHHLLPGCSYYSRSSLDDLIWFPNIIRPGGKEIIPFWDKRYIYFMESNSLINYFWFWTILNIEMCKERQNISRNVTLIIESLSAHNRLMFQTVWQREKVMRVSKIFSIMLYSPPSTITSQNPTYLSSLNLSWISDSMTCSDLLSMGHTIEAIGAIIKQC